MLCNDRDATAHSEIQYKATKSVWIEFMWEVDKDKSAMKRMLIAWVAFVLYIFVIHFNENGNLVTNW